MAKTGPPPVKVPLAVFDAGGTPFGRAGGLGERTGPSLRRMGEAGPWAWGKERGVAIRRKVSLRSHEESIRRWASEGRDDTWIAYALGTSAGSIQSFRSRRRIPTEARRGGRAGPRPLPGIDTDGAGPRYEGVIEREAGGRVGLWVDPAISEGALYRERWAARGKVAVLISRSRIVIGAVDGV